jgi:SAM-dependent methyltransferase
MPPDPVVAARGQVTQLVTAAETLAALATALAGRGGTATLPPDLAGAVDSVARTVVPDLDALDTGDARALAGMARAMLAQAAAFALEPVGPPSWSVTDPVHLTSLGQASAALAPLIRDLMADDLDGLGDALAAGGAILDVGAGVAALAISFARTFPAATVVGIDVWAPALELARANVAAADLATRVEIREQDVVALADAGRYDLIWFAGPFIPEPVLPPALGRCATALRSGGWLVFGRFAGGDPHQQALADLRTVRSGGAVLTDGDVVDRLAAAGLCDAHALEASVGLPVRLVAARRPAAG